MNRDQLRHELEILKDFGFSHLSIKAPAPGESEIELGRLSEVASECTACGLAGGRTKVVFGVGNPNADLMFVGEGPGRDEDLQGEPFVGRAGKLLTDIIKAMKLRREDVYIANTVKCRPPQNRNPEPEELEACRHFIDTQIRLVAPKVIVTLGKVAYQALMKNDDPISRVRGSWQLLGEVPVMPTFHPAYLLRNPSAKRDVWDDMKKVMAKLDLEA